MSKEIQTSDNSQIVNILERALFDESISVEKLNEMYSFYEKVKTKEAEKEFTKSMVNAQSKMPIIAKKGYNNHTNSFYTKFEDMQEIVIPIASENGFSISFDTAGELQQIGDDYMLLIIATVTHEKGFSRTYRYLSPLTTKGTGGKIVMTAQHGMKSAISYAERILTSMIFNIIEVDSDDDGNLGLAGDPRISESQISELNILIEKLDDSNILKDIIDYCKKITNYEIKNLGDLRESTFKAVKETLKQKLVFKEKKNDK